MIGMQRIEDIKRFKRYHETDFYRWAKRFQEGLDASKNFGAFILE
jgi:hypothetical protein